MSIVYTQAQKYGLVPRTESSNPIWWVEQSAKSSYKPIVLDPSSAAKIFETLSGADRALAILVAATGIRISEALGLKWEDIDYQTKQINLR
ncbi:integrase [Edaphobacter lichenicola]|uniref:Integrase n=1 Tax=Tunturiibacter lichenicola TaxID=2051959 RepID=A0A7W8J695_9BACT|nr:integrase [Edaphobacter lichenicola]